MMGGQGDGQRRRPACPLVRGQLGCGLHLSLGGARQRDPSFPGRQQVSFRLAHQTDKDSSLPAALPSKATHNLGEVVVQLLGLRLQDRPLGGTLLRNLRDNLEDFFFALYKVAASLTRWLPCSLGK